MMPFDSLHCQGAAQDYYIERTWLKKAKRLKLF